MTTTSKKVDDWTTMPLKDLLLETLQNAASQAGAFTRPTDEIGQLTLQQIATAAERVKMELGQPKKPTLDDLLEDINVHAPGLWENNDGPQDWYAVSTPDESIIAYFGKEADANFFRLALVNAMLNEIGRR